MEGFKQINFPFALKSNAEYKLHITAQPNTSNYLNHDTIFIHTRNQSKPYAIYSHIRASHITYDETPDFNFNTTETNYTITLSKQKDKYLYLIKNGTSTAVVIKNDKTNRHFKIDNWIKIDLADFEPSKYNLLIMGCSSAHKITLVILD